MRIRCIFLLISLFCVAGCNLGEPMECFPELTISFMRSPDIDSIQLYLNNEQVCYEKGVMSNGICENCTKAKGYVFEYIICNISNGDSDYVYFSMNASNIERCAQLGGYLEWVDYRCSISEKQYRKALDSLVLSIRFSSKKEEMNIQTSAALHGGKYYDIIAEEDTAKWYGHRYGAIDSYLYPGFTWEREGCLDDYCIRMRPLLNGQACYDK